jgi:hypothetical protein
MRFAHDGQSVLYGENWTRALAGDTGHHLFMPGGNGTLYPPGSLAKGVTDLSRALELCPTADDIWFWGHALKEKTPMFCLGMVAHRPVKLLSRSPALSDINHSANHTQFEKLLKGLNLEITVKNAVKKAHGVPMKAAKAPESLPSSGDR